SPQGVPISGSGTTPAGAAPAVTFTPTSLTFAALPIGATSAAQSVNVANTGNAPLFINSAATRGANPLDFTEVNNGCSGLTLAAGTSCNVAINFSPTASGTRSGTLIVTDNAPASPQTVPITATVTGTFSLAVAGPPSPTPPGCQTGGTLKEPLSGPTFNGQTPSGQAVADETKFSGCGGFSILSVQVKNVNLPDGTQLWVTLDF